MSTVTQSYQPIRKAVLPQSIDTAGRPLLHAVMLAVVLGIAVLLASIPTYANDIRITNSILVPGADGTPDRIQFNIAWENSWRHPFSTGINNWDAAWVFIKYREVGNTNAAWSHLYLSNNTADWAAGTWNGDGPGDTVIEPGLVFVESAHSPAIDGDPSGRNPVVGALMYRGSVGRGLFESNEVALSFDFAENGMDRSRLYDIKVFAIEMVYIPQGAYFVGTGGTEPNSFRAVGDGPFRLTSENALTLGGDQPGSLRNNNGASLPSNRPSDDFSFTVTQNLPAAFPKGFRGFYMMKYETTQVQFVQFLNTLAAAEQVKRTDALQPGFFHRSNVSGGLAPRNRNGIKCVIAPDVGAGVPGVYANDLNNNNVFNEADDGQWIAMNLNNTADHNSFLSWAGLRPQTELELEKAARGFAYPTTFERAWGAGAAVSNTVYLNPGQKNESPSIAGSNLNSPSSVGGPGRVGMFAMGSTNRVQAGASFFGVLDISGNVHERVVSVGNSPTHIENDEDNRAFAGTHGIGRSDVINTDWSPNSLGYRGGMFSQAFSFADRVQANFYSSNPAIGNGFRGVRTATCINSGVTPEFDTGNGNSPETVSVGALYTYKVQGEGPHLWLVPRTWTIVSGQGTNEIKVITGTLPVSVNPSNIYVATYTACGAGEEATLTVSIESNEL
jgi:formylglycine-generating enzyme required for sulfatase activity